MNTRRAVEALVAKWREESERLGTFANRVFDVIVSAKARIYARCADELEAIGLLAAATPPPGELRAGLSEAEREALERQEMFVATHGHRPSDLHVLCAALRRLSCAPAGEPDPFAGIVVRYDSRIPDGEVHISSPRDYVRITGLKK